MKNDQALAEEKNGLIADVVKLDGVGCSEKTVSSIPGKVA
jgi:hypothetical protein